MIKASRSKPLLADDTSQIRTRPRKPRNPAQPDLPFDPMPSKVEPCLATLKQKVPVGPEWIYEIKWDGYRLHIHIDPKGVRIITRGGHDWTSRFPTIVEGARELKVTTAILDGEAVMFRPDGRADFGLLQRSLGGRGGSRASEAILMAFDLVYLDGHDLRQTELSARRHLLEGIVPPGGDGAIRYSEEFDTDGDQLLEAACEHGLEGIVAKHRHSLYRSGRVEAWRKIKCVQSVSLVIIGYERSTVNYGGIGRLLMAARKGNRLIYVGGVGTGFNERSARELRKLMDAIRIPKEAVDTGKKRTNVVWVEPTLIAEINHRGWTHEGRLRHPSYKGLREKQDDAAIYDVG